MTRILSSEMFSAYPPLLRFQEASTLQLPKRPRRNRKSLAMRSLTQETYLHSNQLVAPLFVLEEQGQKHIISSMPGVHRYSIDWLLKEVETLMKLGILSVNLFPVIPKEKKDPWGSEAIREGNILVCAVKALKAEFPELCVMADMALDPFTDHGHDGIVNEDGEVINDVTVHSLGKMALLLAQGGVDIVAPSDMMDGRVGYIRSVLDQAGFQETGIMAYAAKYASALYGPFREALHSTPKFGDKKGYQLNPANWREALLECHLDEQEAADILLIKPALAYLDIITKVRENTHLPLAAYQVSGEYAMIKAASQQGWIDGERVMYECLLSIKRAGADFILTYAAREMAEYIKTQR